MTKRPDPKSWQDTPSHRTGFIRSPFIDMRGEQHGSWLVQEYDHRESQETLDSSWDLHFWRHCHIKRNWPNMDDRPAG
jgi:hypothetical protein